MSSGLDALCTGLKLGETPGLKLEGVGSERGLSAAGYTPEGCVVARIPWRLALTAESSMLRLQRLEQSRRGLLPLGLAHLLATMEEADPQLLPPATSWVLALAMQLLAEMRDPHSLFASYVRLLPVPPGSRLQAVCKDGPLDTNLLLFSAPELKRLGNASLAASITAEQRRLQRLHSTLFPSNGGEEPAVSYPSFLWAHCLVRSRALDLTSNPVRERGSGEDTTQGPGGEAAGVSRVQCMLPIIDLCNHAAGGSCTLSLRESKHGRVVDLVARTELQPGDAVTLDYGSRPMRDLLRNYCFMPSDAAEQLPHEIYEGGSLSALLVDGTPGCSALRLSEIQVLMEPGNHSLLEQNRARLLYVIQSGDSSGVSGFGAAVRVVMRSDAASQISRVAKDVRDSSVKDAESSEIQELLWGPCDGATTVAELSPEQEVGVCEWVAHLCREEILAVEVLEKDDEREDNENNCSLSLPQTIWMQQKHDSLARTYSRQRIELLQRVHQDLEAQMMLSKDCD